MTIATINGPLGHISYEIVACGGDNPTRSSDWDIDMSECGEFESVADALEVVTQFRDLDSGEWTETRYAVREVGMISPLGWTI